MLAGEQTTGLAGGQIGLQADALDPRRGTAALRRKPCTSAAALFCSSSSSSSCSV